MLEALIVMLNNYFHDLAVAFLFASTLLAHVVVGHWPGRPSERVVSILTRIGWGSLVWVILGGAVRGLYFKEYEWMPRAGTAQVPVLAAKHVLLFCLTAWGLVGLVRLRRQLNAD